jgi:WD40 repeat protein
MRAWYWMALLAIGSVLIDEAAAQTDEAAHPGVGRSRRGIGAAALLAEAISAAAAVLIVPYTASAGAPPIRLELQWARLADPAGVVDQPWRNGIASAECAEFSRDGRYIVTCSKGDGRMGKPDSTPHRGTAHMRLWDLQGNLIWDIPRSREPLNPTTGRPADQASSGEDEMEVTCFSRDDLYLAAAGNDGKIEIWQVRDNGTHAILAQPLLRRTFLAGAGVDSLRYSHDGTLLFGGTEEAGRIVVIRVQGAPETWRITGKFHHGGKNSNAVNSVDLSSDDRYLLSAGTNTEGGLWRIETMRDANGLITNVNLIRLTTMTHPTSTTREIRLQPAAPLETALVALTSEHDQATFVYRMDQLLNHRLGAAAGPAPIQVLRNSNPQNRRGNPTEPAAFTGDGRFLILTGKTRDDPRTPHIENSPAFIRIFETHEIQQGLPEPDPVYVRGQDVFNVEYLDVNPSHDQLASSHHDGSVRLWKMAVTQVRTIRSEAFNEPSALANRWTLSGPRAVHDDAGDFGSSDQVSRTSAFIGHRGSQYVSARNLGGQVHTLTLDESWNLADHRELQVRFAAAASTGQFEAADVLRLRADLTGTGQFDTIIAEFVPNAAGDLVMTETGQVLIPTFTDFGIDLESRLPANFNDTIRFQLEVCTDDPLEAIGFDSLRVTGVTCEGS